jgi:CubicO group peptidase (beta-lactamase class C family)
MILRNTLGDERYYRFPYDELFYPLGMQNTVLEPDAGGTFVGSSYSFASARDMARFGLLYLNDGIWQGQRLLPEGWVNYSTTPQATAARGEYGAHFWLNAGEPGNPSNRTYPNVPVDLFWAAGYEGQKVFILPSKKLVIVKMSLSHNNFVDDNQFLATIISLLPH